MDLLDCDEVAIDPIERAIHGALPASPDDRLELVASTEDLADAC
jgi:hypothetical protein